MSDKYLNIDLNDPRASAIADVMGNKTAKRILDIIAEKEVSESDISTQLNLPLNTVGYNIAKLLKAGLIEKSKNFFWSAKGKKIPTYKLSNKKILISPKRLSISPMALIASIVGVIALIFILTNMSGPSLISDNSTYVPSEHSLKQFSSYDEMNSFLNERINQTRNNYNRYYGRGDVIMESASGAADSVSPSVSKASGGNAESYSQTNVQVAGVDEPDFVKNDGKYIYMISGNNMYIVLAYPAEEMKIIANVSLGNYASNMFVNGDKIVVFTNGYAGYGALGTSEAISSSKIAVDSIMPCYGYGCGGYSKPTTNVIVYDIKTKENPKVSENYSFDGNYVDARMKGNYVYLISQNYIYNDWPRPMYSVNGMEKEVPVDDIYYSNEYDGNFAFTSVSAISLDNNEVNTKVYILGTSGTIYVSENNIYITNQKWLDYDKQIELKIKEGILPVMPSKYADDIDNILMDDSLYGYQKEQKVMRIVYNYSSSLDKEVQSNFNEELQKSLNEAELKISKEYQKTSIHKIKIDKTDITYVAEGEVPGYLLNQFSLDEYDGNLRVAVTTGNVWGGNSLNHIYVLNDKLESIGKVEDLAKGESIYSTRFMGNRVYVVTFRQTDPLYVIDLSDPSAPKVLGYLKVSGYSSYLHPYDENNIIGIGMEADENGRVNGVKIALFDVTDVNNPKEKANYVIHSESQWSWSSSDALYDHKAFMFDKDKNLLVIPIQYSYYMNNRYQSWNGVYVFYIDGENIELDTKITHIEEYVPKYTAAREAPIGEERKDSSGNTWTKIAEDLWRADKYKEYKENYNKTYADMSYYYNPYEQGNEYIDSLEGGVNYNPYDYSWNKRIQRSLYMDNTLYTVSQGMIKANSLNTFDEINKLEILPDVYYYPIAY